MEHFHCVATSIAKPNLYARNVIRTFGLSRV